MKPIKLETDTCTDSDVKHKILVETDIIKDKDGDCSSSCPFYYEYDGMVEYCILFNKPLQDKERHSQCVKLF